MSIPTYGYRPGEAKIFELQPGEKLPDGWFDTPQAEPEYPEEPEQPGPEAVAASDIDALRDKAKALGIEVDGRWGAKKLEALIAAHEATD